MAIEFTCPKCHKAYRAPDEFAGKTAKCKQCGQSVCVPQPRLAESGDPLAMAGLLDEELASAPAARPIPSPAAGPQCPACQATLSPGAVLCVSCGYDLREGRKLMTVRGQDEAVVGGAATGMQKAAGHSARFLLGVVLSGMGAVIGAVIWAAVALGVGLQIGWIAWGVGLLAGLGMALGYRDGNGILRGLTAAGMALFGILVAKVIIFVGVLLPLLNVDDIKTQRELVAGEIARQQFQDRGIDPADVSDRQWDSAYAEAKKQVAAMSDEEVSRRFQEFSDDDGDPGDQAVVAANPPGGQGAGAATPPNVPAKAGVAPGPGQLAPPNANPNPKADAGPALLGLFCMVMFRPMDLLFVALAVATAFKVGSTAGSD